MKDWRETGEFLRQRWRKVLSEHAIESLSHWSQCKGFDADEPHLIGLPVHWLADGFANGYDSSRFSPERKRQHARKMIEQRYWSSDDLNGRPRGEAIRVAATLSCYFYDAWLAENQKQGINDYGHRAGMKDYAAEVIVKDYFAWRFGVGVRPVWVWELGKAKDVDSLVEAVRQLMDKPKKRREPGIGEELSFPFTPSGFMLKLPPKVSKKR